MSKGIEVLILARADYKVDLASGEQSKLRFHSSREGSAVIPLDNGYVYVRNSEVTEGENIKLQPCFGMFLSFI